MGSIWTLAIWPYFPLAPTSLFLNSQLLTMKWNELPTTRILLSIILYLTCSAYSHTFNILCWREPVAISWGFGMIILIGILPLVRIMDE